ncbi:hypothetical protein B0H10DRAFT_2439402 [Mycena sp. CBHHK59/15]|nr:hypothetical protein B0H10DRAFT_2439402 [Mycena sp. CBHHK59/15]
MSLPPILTIPDEITAEILVHAASFPSHGRVAVSPSSAPLVLTQICRHLREVALDTSALWCSLDFDFDNHHSDAADLYDVAGTIAERWFSRSNDRLLSLTVRRTAHGHFPPSVIPPIFLFSHRFVRIELCLQTSDFDMLNKNTGSFPELQTLAIQQPGLNFGPVEVLTAFRDSPKLRELRLLNGLPLRNVDIGSSTLLTSLETDLRTPFTVFLDLLTQFPGLLHLKMITDRPAAPMTAVTVPHLRSLNCRSSSSTDFLDLLTLPALQDLDISLANINDGSSNFFSLLSRSACYLQSLTIFARTQFDAESLAECLRAVPGLLKLRLKVEYSMDDALKCLHNPTLVPCLRDLSISATGPVEYLNVLVMLSLRRNLQLHGPIPSLTRFQLELHVSYFNPRFSFGDGAWLPHEEICEKILQPLVVAGLEIHIETPDGAWPDDAGYRSKTFPSVWERWWS